MTTPDQFRQLQAVLDHQRAGRISDALKICKRLAREAPDSFECVYLLAMLHAEQRDWTVAIEMFRRAAGLRPEFPDAQYNLAVALSMAARHEEAAKHYEQILQVNPRHLDARNNYAASLLASARALDALHQYDQLIALSPASADAYNNRGMALEHLRRFDQALSDYDKAIALRPDFPQACVNRGNVLVGLRRPDDALASYRKAVALKGDFADAYNNIGNIHSDHGRYEEALEAYDQALALKVDDSEARSMRLYAKMHLCDWSNFKGECSSVISSIKRGAPVYPFTILAFSSSLDEQLRCARLFSKKYPLSARPLWRGETYRHDRIRVAYVSTDFRQHAVASILAGMFENHDRSKFEVTAISIGPDDGSEMRQRLQRAFEHFVDAQELTDDEIAARTREGEIDILIDLNGYTAGARFGIFARRAAPIQVGYLGGTRGADYIDYLIADRTIVTPAQRPYYAEKMVYLPDSFQPVDDKRIVSDRVYSRAELGLPEKGFVFCCFNNSYKIVPRNFDSWMRILKRVDGSVLWLREDKATASANLRKEAEARGIAGERVVFAQRMPSIEEHLGRHRSADLFLDTLPFNAHTTADDALWAGLPVLTHIGEALPGRVGASLLRAVGLPEMIAATEEKYEKIAIELASDPARLEAIKAKLARNRLTTPLFNTALFTRHMEGAFLMIYRRWQAGWSPSDINVRNELP
jgi:predicted O-linked N-acetylglucosamine transferase (SPINDLY family)